MKRVMMIVAVAAVFGLGMAPAKPAPQSADPLSRVRNQPLGAKSGVAVKNRKAAVPQRREGTIPSGRRAIVEDPREHSGSGM